MFPFKELIVWQRAFRLTQAVYLLTRNFPKDQRFGLVDQMQRASVSVMSNIAEGSKRTKAEWVNFSRIALGSAAELESQLLLSQSLHFGDPEYYVEIFEELMHISKILQSIVSKN